MRHPRRAAIALLMPLGLLAACGDDSPQDDAGSTLPPVASTVPTDSGQSYEVPTGTDDVVISVSYEGGFVPIEMVFANTPAAMISGDGRALTTGPVPAIYPGPLLPNLQQRTITPEAVQELVAKADELGLLAEVEYARNDQIADAPDTVVTIAVNGEIFRHRAYALGLEGPGREQDPARANLLEFVTAMTDLPGTVGADQLGPEEPFTPDAYLIRATPADPEAAASEGIEPTLVPWPGGASSGCPEWPDCDEEEAPVRLADAEDCAEVPADTFGPLFADATQLTFFTEPGRDGADVTYQVIPVPRYPGRTC